MSWACGWLAGSSFVSSTASGSSFTASAELVELVDRFETLFLLRLGSKEEELIRLRAQEVHAACPRGGLNLYVLAASSGGATCSRQGGGKSRPLWPRE